MSAWPGETCLRALPGGGQEGLFFSYALLHSFPPSMFAVSVRLSDKPGLPVGTPSLPSWETPSRNLGSLVRTLGCHLGPWTAGETGFHVYEFPALLMILEEFERKTTE